MYNFHLKVQEATEVRKIRREAGQLFTPIQKGKANRIFHFVRNARRQQNTYIDVWFRMSF